jgi:hypothetical protein
MVPQAPLPLPPLHPILASAEAMQCSEGVRAAW